MLGIKTSRKVLSRSWRRSFTRTGPFSKENQTSNCHQNDEQARNPKVAFAAQPPTSGCLKLVHPPVKTSDRLERLLRVLIRRVIVARVSDGHVGFVLQSRETCMVCRCPLPECTRVPIVVEVESRPCFLNLALVVPTRTHAPQDHGTPQGATNKFRASDRTAVAQLWVFARARPIARLSSRLGMAARGQARERNDMAETVTARVPRRRQLPCC